MTDRGRTPDESGGAAVNDHLGHRERMRERYVNGGLDSFADHEVLELLLYYAIPHRDVNPVAHSLLRHFGTLHQVLEAPLPELEKVKGIGHNSATLLSLVTSVARRVEKDRQGKREVISNFYEAQEHCKRLLAPFREERLYVVCLNGQMELLCDAQVGTGGLSEVQVHPRLVADAALRHNAHTVVLCHNHPGGSPLPSDADIEATNLLCHLLNSLEIVLADHIIVADGKTFSMSCNNYLPTFSTQSALQAADSFGRLPPRAEARKKRGKS